jgi:outer membrane receptor protein involved in Fe transport
VGLGDSTGGAAIDHSRALSVHRQFQHHQRPAQLKFGGDVRKLVGDANSNNTPFGNIVFTRDITGNAAAAYMLGFPKNTQTPEGISVSGVNAWRFGPHFQDDWKVNDRLTLNLGIRYDLNLLPKDVNGVSRTLRFDLDPKGPVLWPPLGETHDLWIKEHKHVAPRLGFAYRVKNNWVVRGYGISPWPRISTMSTLWRPIRRTRAFNSPTRT